LSCSSARLKIVRGWPCEVDAAPLRGRDGRDRVYCSIASASLACVLAGETIAPIDGTSVLNVVANGQDFADDTSKSELRSNQVFTSTATGKAVSIFVANEFVATGPPIDNGDGTITFTETNKGLQEKLKLPNGTVLSRDAGLVTFNHTFDATTGEFLGQTISPENGPHPDLDSGFTLFCDVIVPALT
jgi:hypothetical protein